MGMGMGMGHGEGDGGWDAGMGVLTAVALHRPTIAIATAITPTLPSPANCGQLNPCQCPAVDKGDYGHSARIVMGSPDSHCSHNDFLSVSSF